MGRLCSDQKGFFFQSLPIHFAGSDGFKKREKIPWEMWQSSWWHGGGAGWVLVELLGQHTRLLTSSQAPAGHQAADDRHQPHQLQDQVRVTKKRHRQYQAMSFTLGQGRCFCMHKFLLCLSPREGKQDCYIGSVDIKVNCLPRRRSGAVYFFWGSSV